jgi:dolichyl-phosphate-mannose-protein mannosyltransferase
VDSCRIYPRHRIPLESIRMCGISLRRDADLARELWVVAALTLVGGLLRLWSFGRLGLVHFDEGIYALAGLWVFSPRGLPGLDPTIIPYEPPGFPFLVGLAYALLGVGDTPAILVSIIASTLTIPAVGWVGYGTFGRGAGAAAAAFAAFSGPHIAFSRMALTDATFLLFWVVAIGLGQRFLERPGLLRAVMLGLSVGVAQLFKYNGWIAGVLVALSAVVWLLFRPDARTRTSLLTIWGWGLLAALLAAIVYWPWYRFVESHGGYAALLAHHRSYLGGISSWLGHLHVQLGQAKVLSAGAAWELFAGSLAGVITLAATRGRPHGLRRFPRRLFRMGYLAVISATGLMGMVLVILFLGTIALSSKRLTIALIHLMTGWFVLIVLTPFYHPYARLWLPVEAFDWILMGGAFSVILVRSEPVVPRAAGVDTVQPPRVPIVALAVICVLAFFGIGREHVSSSVRVPTMLGPSDSLRQACQILSRDLPGDLESVRLYARPPVTFYLAGRIHLTPQRDLDHLFAPGDPRSWALLDMAMVRQELGARERLADLIDRWTVVREVSTTLNLPTLLDIDPSAATNGAGDRSAPLLLLRPKPPRETP